MLFRSTTNEELKVPEKSNNIFNIKPLRYAASVILLLCLTFVLTTPISIDRNSDEFASFSPIQDNSKLKLNMLLDFAGTFSSSLLVFLTASNVLNSNDADKP